MDLRRQKCARTKIETTHVHNETTNRNHIFRPLGHQATMRNAPFRVLSMCHLQCKICMFTYHCAIVDFRDFSTHDLQFKIAKNCAPHTPNLDLQRECKVWVNRYFVTTTPHVHSHSVRNRLELRRGLRQTVRTRGMCGQRHSM